MEKEVELGLMQLMNLEAGGTWVLAWDAKYVELQLQVREGHAWVGEYILALARSLL